MFVIMTLQTQVQVLQSYFSALMKISCFTVMCMKSLQLWAGLFVSATAQFSYHFFASLLLYSPPHSSSSSCCRSNIAAILQQMAVLCHPHSHNAQAPMWEASTGNNMISAYTYLRCYI